MASALVLIGHGSTTRPTAGAAIRELARAVEATGRYAEVRSGFLKQTPGPAEALDGLACDDVHVVPLFMEAGRLTRRHLPAALAESGRPVTLHQPIGLHPRMPHLVGERALALAKSRRLKPEDTALLLVAHGATEGAMEGAEAVRAHLQASRFAQTELVYISRTPFLTDWRALIRCRDVVVQPLMMGSGLHLSVDVPHALAQAQGHRVVLGTALGGDPGLVELILDL